MRRVASGIAAGALSVVLTISAPAAETVTMNAVVMDGTKVSLERVARPQPGAGEMQIRVHAASVHPVHWKTAAGYSGPPRAGNAVDPAAAAVARRGGPGRGPSGPRIMGSDFSGVVTALGMGVTGWKPGDAVVAAGASSGGAYAEYALVNANNVLAKPAAMSFEEAAGIPGVAATVWNSIVDIGQLAAGQKILIHGAAGGTGSAAVQIAKARGAYVIGTASPRNHAWLKSIGADEVIDYNTENFENRVRDIDVVLNTANLETAMRSVAVVKRSGYLLSIAGIPDPEACKAAGITCAVRDMESPTASIAVLREVMALAARGKYTVNIDRTFPLADYQKAWEYGKEGHIRGKVVLVNASD